MSDLRLQVLTQESMQGADYQSLVQAREALGFFHSEKWLQHCLELLWAESDARLYAVLSPLGKPLMLAPLRITVADVAVPHAVTVASIAHPENFSELNLVFDPTLGGPQQQDCMEALFSGLRQQSPPIDVLRLCPVAAGSEVSKQLPQALKSAGFLVQPYANSFNRFETTQGVSWESYLATRSANQRYNIRRRRRNLERTGEATLNLYDGRVTAEELQRGIDEYVLGTVNSWKNPGSMVGQSIIALIRMAAQDGSLRLATLILGGRPIAGQFWIVSAGTAHCMRLGYDEDYAEWSPGLVLTAFAMEHILDDDQVDCIDFGLGDDAFKENWMRESRDYFGVMAFNPRTVLGLLYAVRHIAGQPVKRGLKRLLGRGQSKVEQSV